MKLIRIIFTSVFIITILVFFMLFFGVQNPGGGCGIFSRQVEYEDYEKVNFKTCGEEQRGNYDNIKNISLCLQDAMDNCEEKKAFIKITGFESSTKYIITTDTKCKVKIKGGSCSITTAYCDTLLEISFGYPRCK